MSLSAESIVRPFAQAAREGNRLAAIAFAAVIVIVSVRAGCEMATMWEYGGDPQMSVWVMFSAIELIFWFAVGTVLARMLIVLRSKRLGVWITLLLIAVWAVAISRGSWESARYCKALADASNPSTSPKRLSELVHFDGNQAGYELDNRIASNPNTPPEALRELSKKPDQVGTEMSLAENPNTPVDVLEELADKKDAYVIRDLRQNPKLPESIRRKLNHREEKTVSKPVPNKG